MSQISHWNDWDSPESLDQDGRILAAPASKSANMAAGEFLSRGKKHILDLACGIGRDTFLIEASGLSVMGVDAAYYSLAEEDGIRSTRGYAAPLSAADARDLPFVDGSFDSIYCFGLLHEFSGSS